MSTGSGDLAIWYKSIPDITRYWFSGSVIVPLVVKIGLINPRNLVLLFEPIFTKFQIWRPLTAVLFYPITPQTGFSYLINLYLLYSYSKRLETEHFSGRPADYMFMLICNWLCLVGIAYFASLYILLDCMIISVMHVWCQLNRDQVVTFYFGTQFQAKYLPYVICAFNMIVRGGGFNEIIGIAVGHLYYFCAIQNPTEFGGAQFVQTPSFMYKLFPNRRNISGFGQAPLRRAGPGGNDNDRDYRNVGGRGHRLGD